MRTMSPINPELSTRCGCFEHKVFCSLAGVQGDENFSGLHRCTHELFESRTRSFHVVSIFFMNTGHLDRAMSRAGLYLCGHLQQLHEDSKVGVVISTLPHDIVLRGLQFPTTTAMLLFPRISLCRESWCKFREGKTVT
jgi:hypothetical protein